MQQQIGRFWSAFLKDFDVYIVIGSAIAVAPLTIIGTKSLQLVLAATLTMLALLAVSLLRNRQTDQRVERRLAEILKTTSRTNRAYVKQKEAYEELQRYVGSHVVNHATLVQYSCKSAKGVLEALLQKGAQVTVYIQHEDVPESLHAWEQVHLIHNAFVDLPGDLASAWNPDLLTVYKYRVPSSLSGVNIDDEVLAVSWYLYERPDPEHPNPSFPEDEVEVSGHDVGGILVWKGTPEFDALKTTFDRLAQNLVRAAEPVVVAPGRSRS